MFRIPLPSTDAVLLLTPRWGDSPLLAALSLTLCLAPVVLLVWLYRYELRLVSRLTALGLLGLRLVALILLLMLVGFQPIVGRSWTIEQPGRVLVAVDRSASMDVADPQRPAVDKLRLARSLKLAGDLCSDAQLDAWIKEYEEKGLPLWVSENEFRDDSERRRRLAEERLRLHEKVCGRVDGWTRSQVARRILSPEGLRLLDAIAGKHQVQLIGFGREAWDLPPDLFDDLFQPPTPSAAERGRLTDLRLPLEPVLKQQDQGKVLGVVLLSDGRHNAGSSPVLKALELGEHQVPIFPIALGARQAPPDVALVAVKAPPTVFKDADAPVEVRVKVSGLPAQEIVVELQRPGEKPLEERIRHDGEDRYHPVRFSVRLDKPGTQAMTVTARPVERETKSDNNSRPLAIQVADDKAKVLLIDGEARWEQHYLASALARDRSMQVESVVFAQPRLGKVSEEELRRLGNPSRALPTGPDALGNYDCIILGDVAPEHLPVAERVRLEKYVSDRGGTLVLAAGKRWQPLGFAADRDDPLTRLLPIEQPRAVTPRDGFPVTLTEEGQLTPFLQLDPEAGQSATRWAELPPHYWGVVGATKPGATPLAFFPAGGDDKKDKAEREKQQAMIVRQSYGFGRVLFVGLDSTWRWRFKVGDLYHHRFWGQAIRWAASDKPLVAGNETARFGAREPAYRQGQPVEVVVRLAEETPPLPAGALAGVRILRQGTDESAAVVPLEGREGQARVLEGQVRDLPPGQYEIELAIPSLAEKLHGPTGPDGKPGRLRAPFTVTGGDGDELVELAANWPLLEELAAKSGGKVVSADRATELIDLLTARAVTHTEHSEVKLWQWWGTLVILLVLLTVEWVARKLAGLP